MTSSALSPVLVATIGFAALIGTAEAQVREGEAAADRQGVAGPLAALGECPTALLTEAYRNAAEASTEQTFSLLAITQDVLEQCERYSSLIARTLTANNELLAALEESHRLADALAASTIAPPVTRGGSAPAAAPLACPEPTATATAPAAEDIIASRLAVLPPPLTCAGGFVVVYTTTGRSPAALVRRGNDEWHIQPGDKLPGGVTVRAITDSDVIVTEQGETITLPPVAAETGNIAAEAE